MEQDTKVTEEMLEALRQLDKDAESKGFPESKFQDIDPNNLTPKAGNSHDEDTGPKKQSLERSDGEHGSLEKIIEQSSKNHNKLDELFEKLPQEKFDEQAPLDEDGPKAEHMPYFPDEDTGPKAEHMPYFPDEDTGSKVELLEGLEGPKEWEDHFKPEALKINDLSEGFNEQSKGTSQEGPKPESPELGADTAMLMSTM